LHSLKTTGQIIFLSARGGNATFLRDIEWLRAVSLRVCSDDGKMIFRPPV
jgi:hypothetical protein